MKSEEVIWHDKTINPIGSLLYFFYDDQTGKEWVGMYDKTKHFTYWRIFYL